MSPEQRLAALRAEAHKLKTKAADKWTNQDVARSNELVDEIAHLEQVVATKTATAAGFAALSEAVMDNTDDFPGDRATAVGVRRKASRPRGALGASGVRTKEFTDNVLAAFRSAAPTVGGPFAAKDLIPAGAITARYTGVIVQQPGPATSLLDVIEQVPVDEPAGRFLQQTARVNRAAPTPVGQLKPSSEYTLTPVDWRVATIAHLAGPFPRQWFADVAGLTEFVSNELAYGLRLALADLLLNGGVDEDGGDIEGILTTSGIGQTEYVSSPLRTIRRSLTDLALVGVTPTYIALHPSAWEDLEIVADAQGRAQMPGVPNEPAPPTLYGVPVVQEPALDEDLAIVGDFTTVQLPFRESFTLAWHESVHEEDANLTSMFARNQLQFRGELRAGVAIGSLPAVRVAELAPGAGSGEGEGEGESA